MLIEDQAVAVIYVVKKIGCVTLPVADWFSLNVTSVSAENLRQLRDKKIFFTKLSQLATAEPTEERRRNKKAVYILQAAKPFILLLSVWAQIANENN